MTKKDRTNRTQLTDERKVNHGRGIEVFDYGKYKSAKPSWELVKAPTKYTDMVWVYPNDPIGHEDIEGVLMENGFDKGVSCYCRSWQGDFASPKHPQFNFYSLQTKHQVKFSFGL